MAFTNSVLTGYNSVIMGSVIAILTDFGTSDHFVGVMKGVIAQISPEVQTIDLTHEIPPGDVLQAAVHLWQAAPYFPDGTVFLVVVDPGVGTSRRSIVVSAKSRTGSKKHFFVGPDNGLFSFIMERDADIYQLQNPAYELPTVSSTFHGRDVYAPAAAHAALGISLSSFGPKIDEPVRLKPPKLTSPTSGTWEGEILYADHFGNLLTSLGCFVEAEADFLRFTPWISGPGDARIDRGRVKVRLPDGKQLPLVQTFLQVPEGTCAAIIGSSGLIEIVSNRRSATEILNLARGEPVMLEAQPSLPA
jgi:S-adenosyl-L-methionine hydrolase (adenosine-forming)